MTTTPARRPKGRPTGGQFAAKSNPESSDDELAGPQRWTFAAAMEAAQLGHLPADFDQWDLANRSGRTVAHSAAFCGHLPADFDQWDLADNNGVTVAHTAALSGHLPTDFDQWDLANRSGRTVLDEADDTACRKSREAAHAAKKSQIF